MLKLKIETDDIPTTSHIVVVDDSGEILQHLKIRKARDYSKEYMLKKGGEFLLRILEREFKKDY